MVKSGSVSTPPEASSLPEGGNKTPVIETWEVEREIPTWKERLFKEEKEFDHENQEANEPLIEDQTVKFDRFPVQLETRGVTSHRLKQGFLFARELIWKESIIAKLDEAHRNELADRVRNCHQEQSIRQCRGCKRHSIFWNRCEVNWCPVCAGRLSRERKSSVEWWTKEIKQPKHVVLTVRNSEVLTREHVQSFKQSFARLRRSKFARHWRGGFYSLEVTNESRGWHLHLHALIDAQWIDAKELSIQWGKQVGQEFAIVKVKDARGADYLAEVTKYAVKGNELSSWSSPDIISFIEAFNGVRTFGVFGSLYAKRTEWKEWLDVLRQGRVKCECGCNNWHVMSPGEFQFHEEIGEVNFGIPPPERKQTKIHHAEFQFCLQPAFPR